MGEGPLIGVEYFDPGENRRRSGCFASKAEAEAKALATYELKADGQSPRQQLYVRGVRQESEGFLEGRFAVDVGPSNCDQSLTVDSPSSIFVFHKNRVADGDELFTRITLEGEALWAIHAKGLYSLTYGDNVLLLSHWSSQIRVLFAKSGTEIWSRAF